MTFRIYKDDFYHQTFAFDLNRQFFFCFFFKKINQCQRINLLNGHDDNHEQYTYFVQLASKSHYIIMKVRGDVCLQ